MDSDLIKSEEQEEKIIEKFKTESPVILLTTQLLFSHKYSISDLIPKPITGIISADSLINIPDFRSEEFLFRQLVLLYSLSEKLVIQTYNPTDPAMSFFSKGDVPEFVGQELENRKQFHYPPFSGLTKLTFCHPDENQARRESFIVGEKIRQIIKQNKIDIEIIGPAPGFISKEKSLFIWNILLKDRNREIKIRNELLRMVSGKGWVVDIDPKSTI
jgi:primosomal protein N' (replication factor Y) (superfamily II helicase)